jgi:hypothetical protein
MYLMVKIGQHSCNTFVNCTTAPAAGVRNCTKSASATTLFDCAYNGVLPPINVTVDFGDGSGAYKWTREDRQDVWCRFDKTVSAVIYG